MKTIMAVLILALSVTAFAAEYTETVKTRIVIEPSGVVRTIDATVVFRDGVYLSDTKHITTYLPGNDTTTAPQDVKAICAVIWTAELITKYKADNK